MRVLMLALLCAFGLLAAVPAGSAPERYPVRPVRVLIPFAPGSATDIVARAIAEELRNSLGQPFVVESKPGASGQIAAEMAARAAPDGYTLFLTTNTTHSANPYLFRRLPYDPISDFTPIGRISYFPFVLAVNADLPVRDMPELVTFSQQRRGQVSYAYGNSTGQVAGSALNMLARLGAQPVAYRSTPQALTDLAGGQIAFMFVDLASSRQQFEAGRLRPLAVSTDKRSALAPDLPTLGESLGLQGFDLSAWVGLFGPAKMPPHVVEQLGDALYRIVDSPKMREKLQAMGSEPAPAQPAAFGIYVSRQLEVWGQKVKDAGIKPE